MTAQQNRGFSLMRSAEPMRKRRPHSRPAQPAPEREKDDAALVAAIARGDRMAMADCRSLRSVSTGAGVTYPG